MDDRFTVLAVVQAGRLAYEALLLAGSVRLRDKGRRLVLAEPQPGPLWDGDPRVPGDIRAELEALGAEIRPFESRHFGAAYPYGNKIEALRVLEPCRPFLFLDTDTLVLGPLGEVAFDFDRPSASMRRTGTWPKGDDPAAVWQALYARFGLDFAASLDPAFGPEDWRRYLYFNAGAFYGADAARFGACFEEFALAIREAPGAALVGQSLDPWLDQVALPLVIHALGGGRDGVSPRWIDGSHSCHWRTLPLLYAREPDAVVALLEEVAARGRIKKLLKGYAPAQRMIYHGEGVRVRAMFADGVPDDEAAIRKRLKAEGLWLR